MKKTSLLFTICIIICNSCSEPKKNSEKEIINIVVPSDNENAILNDSIIKHCRIVPLETNNECLVGTIDHIISKGNRIYLMDFNNRSLLVFDQNGKFLFKKKSIGKGPGEYLMIMDVRLDDNGNILILDYNKILTYNADGKFIKENKFNYQNQKNLQLNPYQFAPDGNDGYYFWRGSFGINETNSSNMYALYRADKDGDITGNYFKVESIIYGWMNRFFKGSNNNYYMQPIRGNDTIFSLEKEGVIPYYNLDFGKNKVPKKLLPKGFKKGQSVLFDHINKHTDYSYAVNQILESTEFLCFTYKNKIYDCQAIYSRRSRKTKVGRAFHNMLPSTVPFRAYNTDNDEFVAIIDDYIKGPLMENRKKFENFYSKIDKDIIKVIEKVDDFSNPILVMYKLNDF